MSSVALHTGKEVDHRIIASVKLSMKQLSGKQLKVLVNLARGGKLGEDPDSDKVRRLFLSSGHSALHEDVVAVIIAGTVVTGAEAMMIDPKTGQ